ncbi:MAG TPA: hypothetical protein VEI07_05485, partial [Planctomycetaceae bacterium]|nr:hypothetical protein [Planctomycetaceae bacterium]
MTRIAHVFCASAVLAFSVVACGSVLADSAPAPYKPKPRLLFVDADHPATWPKGLEPIPAGELRRLLGTDKESDSDLAPVQIEQAVYHATFRSGALTEGRAELTLGTGRRPALVPLEQARVEPSRSLDFSHLRWQDASHDSNDTIRPNEALCGIDRTGCRVLIVESGSSRLECDWSLAGRSSLGATEFAICLPPAVVSQLVLRIPAELLLESDHGVVIRGPKESDGQHALWQLELGSRCTCRLRVTASPTAVNQRVFYDQDTTLIVAPDRQRIQSKLQLEVFGAPLKTLRLSVPAGLRVETITYGDDFPLSIPVNSTDKTREISLELPEPLLGKGRTISIEASAATLTNRLSSLPQVDVPGAVRREGQVQLTIRAPLKLVRFGGETGLSQSEAPTYSIDGEETFSLRQNAGDSPLAIEIAEPAPALAARTLARLDLRRDHCTLSAEIVCSASKGSTFSVTFELPEAWNVTRVEAAGDVSRMIDERTRKVAEHRKQVQIDFFRAVTDREPKRFRVEASRPLPRSGEAIDVPVIEFPAFASQEVETLIVHGSSIELGLSPPEAFAALNPKTLLSILANSPLRLDRSAGADSQMLMHRWTPQTAKARFTLRRGEELLTAHVRTSIDVAATQQISERVDATIGPLSSIDRVLVYLPSEGQQFAWMLSSERARPLEGARLAAARHAEWNLPEGGELWEIRLPEPCQREFRLAGTRRTSSLGGAKIGLAFIPGARNFDGVANLRLSDVGKFDVESRELRASNSPTSSDRGLRSFRYDQSDSVLVVRPRSTRTSKGSPRFAALELTSFVTAGGADDFHRAEFAVAPELAARPFHFALDADSRLCSVAVNGEVVRVQGRSDDITVPALPADSWNHVRVEYKTTAARQLFHENRRVIVPRAQAEILSFRWRVFLSPGLQPGGLPSGLRFDQPLPTLSWAERLFGPLGRSSAQMRLSSFTPDAWIVDLAGADLESDAWTPKDRELPPAGWSRWDASAEEMPADLRLPLWHSGKFRTLSWIVCLGCLIAGLAAARLAPRAARRLGPIGVAAAVALALAAPSPYALLAGACVSGAILAALLSRPWKSGARTQPTEIRAPRPGSTVSFELRAVSILLALAALGTAAAFAQETPQPSGDLLPRDAQSLFSTARRSQPAAETDLLVVVPVRLARLVTARDLTIPADNELVYVLPKAIEALRRRAAETSQNEGIVLLSSDYAISLDEQRPATLDATYRVAVLPGTPGTLLLRLANVTLSGANACRVGGRPYPVRADDEGFVLSLDSPPWPADSDSARSFVSRSKESRRPIAAERPGTGAVSARPRVFEIRLTCFPSGGARPGQFEMRIPETVHTTVRMANAGPWQTVTVEAANGIARRLRPGDASTDVGQTDHLRLKAGPVPTESANTSIVAQAAQFLRVSPGLVELECHVTYDRENSTPAKFTWLVPSGAAVRTTGDTYRAALRTKAAEQSGHVAPVATDGQLVPLDFDCSTAPAGPITLTATLLLPIDPNQSAPGAPPFNVLLPKFDRPGADEMQVTLKSNEVGVSASGGYRVTVATSEPNLSHTPKVDATFRQESFGTRREPDLIFDCQGISALPLQLAAIAPAHKVRLMTHEARVSADRIQWKTTAEIRTENAPAFVHVLRVDPRLKVDSVSVREDDVERLVRFTQSGDDVTLFLRDRAAATQDLVLTGHMPLEPAQAAQLPTVSLRNAMVSERHLTITHGSEVDVAVSSAAGIERINAGSSGSTSLRPADATGAADILEYSLATTAVMPEVRVTSRPEKSRIVRTSGGKIPNSQRQSSAPRPTTFKPRALDLGEQKPRVDVLDIVDVRRDRSLVGSTHVLLERFVEPSLQLSWPASISLRGALLDGRPIQPVAGDDWISLAVPSDGAPHRIALYWESRAASPLYALAHISEQLPAPGDGLVRSILLSLAVPPRFRLWAPTHFASLDPSTFAQLCNSIQSGDRRSPGGELSGATPALSADVSADSSLTGRLEVAPTEA